MFCPNCGSENKDAAKFCKNCGQPLGVCAAPARRKRSWPALVALLMLAVVSVVAGVVGYRRLRPATGKPPYTAETPAAVQHTFEAATGTDWDTGIGLKVSIPPAQIEGGVELVVERFAPEQLEDEVVALHSVYDISLVSTSTPQEHSPITLTFEIPEGVDPHSAVILQWTEEGWALAECKEGLPGGTVSSDGEYVSITREQLSKYAIAEWLCKHIFRHFENLPEPPPPSPIIEVEEAEPSSLYPGYQVVEVALESPTIWRSFGGTWYEIVVRGEDQVRVEGSGYLAPGEKRNLEILFRSTGGHATVCLNTGGALPRATLDWADRLGVPGTEAEFLVEIVERFRDRPADWKDSVWAVKNLLVKLIWKALGSIVKFYVNVIPVSIDIATYINALTDDRPDPCVDAYAESATPPAPPVAPPPAPPAPPIIGGMAYVATEDDLWVIDVSDPGNPHKIGRCGTPYSALGVFMSGPYAYLADGYADLRVIDVSNPAQPNEVSHSDVPKGALDVFVSGSYAYVVDRDGFLHVIDISNPVRPYEIGYYDAGGLNVFVSGSYAYVATGYSLRVIDVSEPSNPDEVGCWGCEDITLFVSDVHVHNGFAYVVAGDTRWGFYGLRVVDVSRPADSYEVGGLDIWRILSVDELPVIFVSNSYAYVVATEKGRASLRVVSVSDPSNPYEVGQLDVAGQAKGVFVLGSYVYLAAGTAGLRVIDVSEPSKPYEVGYWDDMPTLAEANGVFATGLLAPIPHTPKPALEKERASALYKALAGKWQLGTTWIEFSADGTLKLGDDAGTASGTYNVIDDDTIQIDAPDKAVHGELVDIVSISENTLTLKFSSSDQTIKFGKPGHPIPTSAPTPAPTSTSVPVTPTPTLTPRERMVEIQIRERGVEDEDVLAAMEKVPRHEFVPPKYLEQAYADHPLPIGYGQTISQPYIVAWMTELLEIEEGDKVLEIGTGSGYQAAVLAEIADQVYTVEIIEELEKSAEERLKRLGYTKVNVKHADGYYGWEEHAPYDAIIVTCAPDHIPQPLVQQLKDGSRMVIPVGPPGGYQSLWQIRKQGDQIITKNMGGVRFVPLQREEH